MGKQIQWMKINLNCYETLCVIFIFRVQYYVAQAPVPLAAATFLIRVGSSVGKRQQEGLMHASGWNWKHCAGSETMEKIHISSYAEGSTVRDPTC